MAEIVLDPDIRVWVFLPIVIITFLVGIAHHITVLLTNDKTVDIQSVSCGRCECSDVHALMAAGTLVNASLISHLNRCFSH